MKSVEKNPPKKDIFCMFFLQLIFDHFSEGLLVQKILEFLKKIKCQKKIIYPSFLKRMLCLFCVFLGDRGFFELKEIKEIRRGMRVTVLLKHLLLKNNSF